MVGDVVQRLLSEVPERMGLIVLAGLRGSDAHGTKLPVDHPMHTDDVDTFGIGVRPAEWYLGLNGYNPNRKSLTWDPEIDGDHDPLVHDVRKFFHLAARGNPNVQCWLWSHPDDVLALHPAGEMILESRQMFLSRRCFAALAGYAHAQMKKMSRTRYQGYQGARRKKIVDEIGYDVKHAAHCVRLMNMAIELSTEGVMSTRRPPDEAAFLMEIKAGEHSFAEIEEVIAQLFDRFNREQKSADLPKDVDMDALNELLCEVIYEVGLDQA